MSVTIKDIARETGLSTATISKYLNHKPILEENRILIEETIRRLDYKPNRTAQYLRSKKTKTIGILISDLGNYFWSSVVTSVSQFFMNHHYTAITSSYYFDTQKESEVIQDMISQNLDGVIMLPNSSQDNLYKLFQDAGIPIVLLDQLPVSLEQSPVDCVVSDNYGGACLLTQHLIDNGHQNIYILERSVHSYTLEQRFQAFNDTLIKNRCDSAPCQPGFPPIAIVQTETVIAKQEAYFHKIMALPHPPTAIFCINYLAAMGALTAINANRYSIPDDISLVSFDDDPRFKAMPTPITCVSQNLKQIGETASEILMQRIEGDFSDFPRTAVIDVDFHLRRSVKDLR